MAIRMSESEYQRYIENLPDEGNQAWMDYIGNGGSMDPSDTFDAGWNAGQARIRQLEKLNATLSAEVDAMTPIVERVHDWLLSKGAPARAITLSEAFDTYQARKLK